MDDTTLQIVMWFPAIFLVILGVLWYFSFPKKQRKNHNAESLGLIALGIVISLFIWSLWLIYHIEGTDSMKVTLADKVVWSIVFGIFGTLSALAVLTIVAVYKRDDNSKMSFKRKPSRKPRTNK